MTRPERPPLQPVTTDSGATIGWCAATTPDGQPDQTMTDLLASIIRKAAETERLQHERREAIKAGIIPPCPWDAADKWHISDRD
jgi:hypothetical protein